MPHVDRYVSVTQAKSQLLDLVRRLGTQQDSIGITRRWCADGGAPQYGAF